jgi:membrane protein DedA with SNARE-associated domain
MDIQAFEDTVIELVRTHQAWAPFIVAALAFADSLAIVSLFLFAPATVLLLAIAGLIGGAGLAFLPIWLAAAVGACLGDWLSYEIGRLLEDKAHHVWPLSRYQNLIVKGEEFTRKYGVWAIFIGRFFGPARAFVPLAAGIFEMPRTLYLPANIASAMLWAFLLLAPWTGLTRWLL